MDILRFINSKDIRSHLEKIGYRFNSLETAWLIYQCRNATIKEKHKAWTELIETMPDCRIEERSNTVPQESLHSFLKNYMELENRYLKEFYDDKHADTYDDEKPFVFKFEYFCKDGQKYDYGTVFSCFDAIYETIMEPEDDVAFIKCTKIQIDRLNRWPDVVYMTPSFEILKYDPGRIEKDNEDDIYWGVFDGLWFDFPTPFHKGDIVWNTEIFHGATCATGPFVMTGACLDGIKSDKVKDSIRKRGDSSYMLAIGYFLAEDGSIYSESMWNYMDLEYYEKELTGPQRTLIALSNFIKGEIDHALFAQAYHQIITNGYAEDSMPKGYLKSGLILAGLNTH